MFAMPVKSVRVIPSIIAPHHQRAKPNPFLVYSLFILQQRAAAAVVVPISAYLRLLFAKANVYHHLLRRFECFVAFMQLTPHCFNGYRAPHARRQDGVKRKTHKRIDTVAMVHKKKMK